MANSNTTKGVIKIAAAIGTAVASIIGLFAANKTYNNGKNNLQNQQNYNTPQK